MDRLAQLHDLLQKDPTDSFLQHALALEYLKLGQDQEAEQVFEKVLRENPAYVGSYYHLAGLQARMGQKESAIEWYEKGMVAAKSAGDNHAFNELRAAYDELVD